MKSFVSFLFSALVFTSFVSGQSTTWNLDASHSSIQFVATHLLISEVSGNFNSFEGSMVSNKEDFSDAEIQFSAEINSIDTDDEKRDGHLQSPEFFDAAQYPEMSFKSTSFEHLEGNKYKLTGELTIRDVTQSVALDVTYGGSVTDPWGQSKLGFKATGTINRFDYGLKWNAALETGGLVVGEEIGLNLNVQFVRQSESGK